MSPSIPKKDLDNGALPVPPDDVRSGSGAETALKAMLKKRQMHATLDSEIDAAEQPKGGEGN